VPVHEIIAALNAKMKKTRRTPRLTHDPVQRERLRQTEISIRKIRRNELVA
jgi:hypothetical protein